MDLEVLFHRGKTTIKKEREREREKRNISFVRAVDSEFKSFFFFQNVLAVCLDIPF